MAQRRSKPPMASSFILRQFPPEADGKFDVVSEAEITQWRERLSQRFGIGEGRLRVVDDPVHAG